MKELVKKTLVLLLAFAMVFSMAACGGSGETADASADTPAEIKSGDRIKISFWTIIPEGDPCYADFMELVNGFNAAQDQYEIEHVGYPFLDFFGKMTTAFSGGVAPDVFMYTMEDVPARAANNTVVNLTPYMERDGFDTGDYYELELEAGVYEGGQYALPLSSTCRMLWYNLDMFEEVGLTEADVPTTWDELYEVAHKMDVVNEGIIERLGFDPTAGQSFFHPFLWQAGLDFFDENGDPLLTQQDHVDVLQWFLDFNKDYSYIQRQSFTDTGKTLAADPFVSGRVGMMIGNDSEYSLLTSAEVDFRYGVTTVPMPEDGVRTNWSSCWSIEAFNSGDEDRINGAWEFIKYMSTKENAEKFYDALGWLTASKSANEGLKDDPIMAKIIEELPYSTEKVYWDFAPKWQEDFMQFQEAALADGDAQAAMEAAQTFFIEKKANFEATH